MKDVFPIWYYSYFSHEVNEIIVLVVPKYLYMQIVNNKMHFLNAYMYIWGRGASTSIVYGGKWWAPFLMSCICNFFSLDQDYASSLLFGFFFIIPAANPWWVVYKIIWLITFKFLLLSQEQSI